MPGCRDVPVIETGRCPGSARTVRPVANIPVVLERALDGPWRELILVFFGAFLCPFNRDPGVWNPPARELFVSSSRQYLAGIGDLIPRRELNAVKYLLQGCRGVDRAGSTRKGRELTRVDTVEHPNYARMSIRVVPVDIPRFPDQIVSVVGGFNETTQRVSRAGGVRHLEPVHWLRDRKVRAQDKADCRNAREEPHGLAVHLDVTRKK